MRYFNCAVDTKTETNTLNGGAFNNQITELEKKLGGSVTPLEVVQKADRILSEMPNTLKGIKNGTNE